MEAAKPVLATMEECERRHILTLLEHARWKVSGKTGAALLPRLNGHIIKKSG